MCFVRSCLSSNIAAVDSFAEMVGITKLVNALTEKIRRIAKQNQRYENDLHPCSPERSRLKNGKANIEVSAEVLKVLVLIKCRDGLSAQPSTRALQLCWDTKTIHRTSQDGFQEGGPC